MNKVFLTGRMVADPNPIATAKNIPVTKFSVACNDANNRTKVEFIPCTCFNQTATYANTYLKKGDYVIVEGHISISKYTNRSGGTSYTTDVIVENLNSVFANSNSNRSTFSAAEPAVNTNVDNKLANNNEKISIDEAFQDSNMPSQSDLNKKEEEKSIINDDDEDFPEWMKEIDD